MSHLVRLLRPTLAALLLAACSDGGNAGPDAAAAHSDAAASVDGGLAAQDASASASDVGVAGTDAGAGADVGSAGADAAVAAGPDAAMPQDAAYSPDVGPIKSCSDIPAQGCLSNEGCPASDVCRSFSTTLELRCCISGARGTGEAGATCANDGDCAFGRCLERNDHQWFCSGACSSDLECPGIMFCSSVMHWCVPRDAGAPPKDCNQVGKTQCAYNDNCSASERCENLGTAAVEVLCCTTGARGTKKVGQACTSELDCEFGRCLGSLCSAECDYDVDPCPPATMVCNEIRGLCEPK